MFCAIFFLESIDKCECRIFFPVKNRKLRSGLLLCLLVCLLPAFSGAQEASISPELLKTCLFPTVDLSQSDEYQDYRQIIYNQIHTELQSAGFALVAHEEWEAARERRGTPMGELYRGTAAAAVAGDIGADLTVVSSFSVEEQLMAIDIKCYDVAQKALIAGVFKTARVNLSIYNAIAEAAAELIPRIHLLGPPPSEKSPVVKEITLLSNDEGMQIYLGQEGYIGSIGGGRLPLPPIPFALGTKIDIEKRKEGYHPGEETLKLKEPEMDIRLKPLLKKTYMATEVNWTLGQLLGFGLAQRFYLKPDVYYVGVEHYLYLQHGFSGGKPVFHHDLRALFGGYLFSGPHRFVRFNVSTGLGMIVTYFVIKDQPMYADFYWNLLNAALELNFADFLLYLRAEAKYALGLGPMNLLGRDWISVFGDSGPSAVTLGFAWKW